MPRDVFESKFEEQVAQALERSGFKVWPQYEAAGFYIDLVVYDGKNWIAVECDGPNDPVDYEGVETHTKIQKALIKSY